jgi:hypothetical protein
VPLVARRKEGIEMKKLLGLTALVVTLLPMFVLVGCSTSPEEEQVTEPVLELTEEQNEDCVRDVTVYPPQPCPVADDSFTVFAGSLAYGDHGYFAYRHIEFMQENLPNRVPFTYEELAAAEWIVDELLEMGFSEDAIEMTEFNVSDITIDSLQEFELEFTDLAGMMTSNFESAGYYDVAQRRAGDDSQNVILTIPGQSDEVIIVGAHYDSPGQASISDNAGGVALLLESAHRMQEADNYYTIQYVFFGAEEAFLVGVLDYTLSLTEEELDNIVLMINADVILDGPDLMYATGYINSLEGEFDRGFGTTMMLLAGPEGRSEVHDNDTTRRIDELASELNASYDLEFIAEPKGVFVTSDHLAFLEMGLPVLVFYATHPLDDYYPEDLFIGDVFHSVYDDLNFMNETFPGRVERALQTYSVFLEQILLANFE